MEFNENDIHEFGEQVVDPKQKDLLARRAFDRRQEELKKPWGTKLGRRDNYAHKLSDWDQ